MSKGSKKDQDLTRIENLSEFNHEDDTEVDRLLESFNTLNKKSSSNESADDSENEGSRLYNLDELEDSPSNENEAESSDSSFDSDNDTPSEMEESSFEVENSEFSSEEATSFGDTSWDSSNDFEQEAHSDFSEEYAEEGQEEVLEDSFTSEFNETELPPPFPESNDSFDSENIFKEENENVEQTEKEAKEEDTFSENSSDITTHYGEVQSFGNNISPSEHFQTAANPPYSIIIENIQYSEDAQKLQNILTDFDIINAENTSDYQKAINNGRVLVPQISEYKAIMLGHALRKFNFTMKIGLSHQVFASSSQTDEFRGLISKKFVTQNFKENASKRERNFEIDDIQVTSLAEIPDFNIEQLHDVKTLMSVISDEELQRLEYVEHTLRDQAHLDDVLRSEQSMDEDTRSAYESYQKSFEYLYTDMVLRLKQEAFDLGFNAVIGIHFQMTPMVNPAEQKISYSITCSATFATITKKE